MSSVRNYSLVTLSYWGFTLTDGALRMLVLLHFHKLGYSSIQLAFLFLLYEFFGIVTNLVGGWLGARLGLRVTLFGGLALQVVALAMLTQLNPEWTAAAVVAYVMASQALSGIAKDLTKMSAKSAIKTLVPDDQQGLLFKWVALLTGSKNALKGLGFFLGGFLLTTFGFNGALWGMAGGLALILILSVLSLPQDIGRAKEKPLFSSILSHTREINILSAARFFLFGSRDAWFVVGLPIFLYSVLDWTFTQVGAYMAFWVIGYGAVQALSPQLLALGLKGAAPTGRQAMVWAFLLLPIPALIALAIGYDIQPAAAVLGGLILFGIAFAVNSAVHSYLIVAYAQGDRVAMNVGFYYMSNAGGRLLGTLLSGVVFQWYGLVGCLWTSAILIFASGMLAVRLPR
ncbi:MAG TPA: organoarsenical effux MFS transporter ArsJ [Kiritimatiellia bacterium]|nr:organoarsenical effux MFS transporter ArsJ [Kiritimatiellia bacterium]HMO98547.1 organoarsenical effux MFS transporter ArsJ [Kiritimatiellia bacterium]HMP96968.1 organoarsenical effux MFS transporter ArsJ [Kiritimatiellia bacterium]